MHTTRFQSFAALVFLSAVCSPSAQAVPLCSNGTATESISTGNLVFRGVAADDCYGVIAGNDTTSALSGVWGGGWTQVARDNTDGSPDVSVNFGGLNWVLNAPDATSGNWSLILTDPAPAESFPLAFDLVGVLKGGSEFAAYLFTQESFADIGTFDGSFQIVFANGGGRTPSLSHLTLYARTTDVPTRLPEPGTLGLAALALVLVASTARLRRRP